MPDAPAPHLDPGDVAPIEQRLGADQIAELDRMNTGFGGPQLGDEDGEKKQVSEIPKPAGETKVEPAITNKPEPPAEINTGDLPPEDVTGDLPTKPAAGEEKPSDFKTSAELMPEEEISKLRTVKSQENIRALASSHDKAVKEVHALKKTVEELEKRPNTDARVADLEKRNAELNSIVEKKALEEHPYVVEQFAKPRQNAMNYGRKALEDADMDPNMLDRVIGTTGKERIAALDQLYDSISSPTIRSKVEKAVAVIEGVDEQRSAFFADREGNHAKMKEQEAANQARQLADQEKNARGLIDQVVNHLGKDQGFSFLAFSDKPGAEKWNEGLKSDINQATEFLLKNTDPAKLVTMVLLGIRAPKMQVGYKAMLQRALAAEKAQSEGRSALPSLNGSGHESSRQVHGDPNEGLLGAARRAITDVTQRR